MESIGDFELFAGYGYRLDTIEDVAQYWDYLTEEELDAVFFGEDKVGYVHYLTGHDGFIGYRLEPNMKLDDLEKWIAKCKNKFWTDYIEFFGDAPKPFGSPCFHCFYYPWE